MHKVIILVVVAVVAGVSGVMLQSAMQKHWIDKAYSVCNTSHFSIDGRLEEECGRLQDKTGTEYLCDQDGRYCWLEVK